MPADVAVHAHREVDEAERIDFGTFGQVVRDRVLDITVGLLARDDGPGLHGWGRVLPAILAAPRTRSRKRSKSVFVTGSVGADDALASSRLRRCSRS